MTFATEDIVDRLRVIHCAADDLTPCGTCLPCQAADEIERLRAENERLRAAGDALAAAVNAVACSGTQDEMTELTDAFLDWEARRV